MLLDLLSLHTSAHIGSTHAIQRVACGPSDVVISTTSQLCSHHEQQSADTLAEDGVSREEVSRERKCFVMWGRKHSLAGHHKLCFIKQKLKLVVEGIYLFED